jgi:hypothetical protein
MKTMSKRWIDGTLIPAFRQEFAQILGQWIWNLRLELGQQLSSTKLRTTEFAPACEAEVPLPDNPKPVEAPTPAVLYGPPQWARPSFTHGFPGSAFTPQPDGTLRCPANHPLYLQERRPERNGSDAWCCMPHASAIAVPVLMPCEVAREQYDDQAATRECCVVAARIFTPSVLLSTHGRTSGTAVCSRSLERLASMCHSAKVVESGP